MRDGRRDDFAERLRERLAPLLRAVRRRQLRAEARRGALFRPGGETAGAASEGLRWEQLRDAYRRSHDALLDALAGQIDAEPVWSSPRSGGTALRLEIRRRS